MKHYIHRAGRWLFALAVVSLGLTACDDDAIDDSKLVEFGLTDNVFTVGANAGHIDLKLMSNQDCNLYFAEETPWAEISVKTINGDGKFFVDYDDNPEFPRMAKVIVEAPGVNLADTIVIRQRGSENPDVKFESGTMILKGSVTGEDEVGLMTNLESEAIDYEIDYTAGDGADWIKSVELLEGKMKVAFEANASSSPRSATMTFSFDNGWGEIQNTKLYVTQMTSDDKIGYVVSFEEVRNKAVLSADVEIDDFYIIKGIVISNKASRNAGDNIQTAPTSIDYSICDRTVYLESEDGKYGFSILCATEADNVFDQYDHVELSIKGCVLHAENDPYRYDLSGVTTAMIVGRTAGSAADVPVKEKYISELDDDDMYTYVTLKDCEFPVRQGSLTPIHDGYTLADNAHRMAKYPRLMRDIEGSSIYLYTNTTCPYRRDGRKLPYGSGKISGVVVFEYFKAYVYGDGYDDDTHGRIGTYQLRHQNYSDIQFDESETFSGLVTEYRYLNGRAKAEDGLYYWKPTYGSNGRMTHTSPRNSTYGCTSWNYLGWTGTAKGIEPFKNHIGDDGSGQGIILEDGTDYRAKLNKFNLDGKGQGVNTEGNAWASLYWWEEGVDGAEDTVNSWLVEFSTEGIVTDRLSMQMSVQGCRALENTCPIFWKAEWSTERDLTDASKWHLIAEYQVPDFPIWANYHEWQLPAFKQIDFPLPLEMLGKKTVYVRLTPTSKAASTTFGWNAGEVADPYKSAGNGMDYFAIRYNKQ